MKALFKRGRGEGEILVYRRGMLQGIVVRFKAGWTELGNIG